MHSGASWLRSRPAKAMTATFPPSPRTWPRWLETERALDGNRHTTMKTNEQQRNDLEVRLLQFIGGGEGAFDELALALFHYQLGANKAYRAYCERIGVETPSCWRDIPTVATDVFRWVRLFCGEPSQAKHIFRTSGTTSGQRGEHYLRELNLYHASAAASIRQYLLPDGMARPALMLAPPPLQAPDSSLSSMLGLIEQHWTGGDTLYAWGAAGLDAPAAVQWLADAAAARKKVQVLATAFALVELLDRMSARGMAARLAPGSVLMLTGGTKGKSRSVATAALEQAASDQLGFSPTHIVHEYGMTELGSQLYSPWLAAGKRTEDTAGEGTLLVGPRWCRVTVHAPQDLRPLPIGASGLLRFTDLSNLDSVASVQTSDLGSLVEERVDGDIIRLYGRIPGAVPRGCSLW